MTIGDTVTHHGKAWKIEELCQMALLKAGATKIWVRVRDLQRIEEINSEQI